MLEKNTSGLSTTRDKAVLKQDTFQEWASLLLVCVMSILGNIILNSRWSPEDLLASYYVHLIVAASLGRHLSNDSVVALRSLAISSAWCVILPSAPNFSPWVIWLDQLWLFLLVFKKIIVSWVRAHFHLLLNFHSNCWRLVTIGHVTDEWEHSTHNFLFCSRFILEIYPRILNGVECSNWGWG